MSFFAGFAENPSRWRRRPGAGASTYGPAFTVLEMLLAMSIAGLVILGVTGTFTIHCRTYRAQRDVRDMQQNLQTALEIISREIRMAGYGLAIPPSKLALWIPWVPGIAANPHIAPGATAAAPDSLCVVGSFDGQVAALSAAVTNGATTLPLQYGQGSLFNTNERRVIYLGRCETLRVVGRSGDTLTVSRDPTTSGRGLRYAYAAGAPVELVKAVTYTCRNDVAEYAGRPQLLRDASGESVPREWQKIAAACIEDFQVVRGTNCLTLTVGGRTRHMDAHYTDPDKGDAYRRMRLTTQVLPRNTQFPVLP